MKKLTAVFLVITMVIAAPLTLGAITEEPNDPQYADMSDALAILREVIALTQTLATVETHDFNDNGKLDIGDALLVLRGIIGLNDRMVMNTMNEMSTREFEHLEPLSEEIALRIKSDYLERLVAETPSHLTEGYSVEGIIIVRYYGTYNSCVVLTMRDAYTESPDVYIPPSIINIAGHEFSIPAFGGGIGVWNDGEFLGLAQAYEEGWLTEQDVGEIWWRFNNPSLSLSGDAVTERNDEMPMRDFEPLEPLSEDISLLIRTTSLERLVSQTPEHLHPEQGYSVDMFFIDRYFGTYNSSVAVMTRNGYVVSDTGIYPPRIVVVVGYEFSFYRTGIAIWNNGEFLGISQAYEEGWLTEQDVVEIWWRFNNPN